MSWVAWKMLNGDPVKYLGTVFGVAFGVLLFSPQCSIAGNERQAGDLLALHVRVDIDENDLPRFRPGLPGTGHLRGDAGHPLKLDFVRVKRFAEPRKALTGAGNERVDTRVLQVIYQILPSDRTVYVGQQIDVYLDAAAK